jgi:hypothetical protein
MTYEAIQEESANIVCQCQSCARMVVVTLEASGAAEWYEDRQQCKALPITHYVEHATIDQQRLLDLGVCRICWEDAQDSHHYELFIKTFYKDL